jgi:hypothetical protein
MEQAREALKKLNVLQKYGGFRISVSDQASPACVDEPAVQVCRLPDMAVRASRGQLVQGREMR